MSKQGISTGSAPNDGTGDTLLAGTIKINNNFNEIYDIFGDGSNLVSFVSFASTAGYSTNCGIASTSVLAGLAASVTDNIDINTSGVVTSSYADVGKITIQQQVQLQMDLLKLDLLQQCSESKQTVWSALEHHYLLHN